MWFHYIYMNKSLYIANEILKHVWQLVFIRTVSKEAERLIISV